MGNTFTTKPAFLGPQWVEVEALWPDGRRVFGATSYDCVAPHAVTALTSLALRVSGITGQNFLLQRSTDLQQWTPVLTNTFDTSIFEFTDPEADGLPSRFYRAVAVP